MTRVLQGRPSTALSFARATPYATVRARGTHAPLVTGVWDLSWEPEDISVATTLPVPIGGWVTWDSVDGPADIIDGGVGLRPIPPRTATAITYELASKVPSDASIFHALAPLLSVEFREGGVTPSLGGPRGAISTDLSELYFAISDAFLGKRFKSGPFGFDTASHVVATSQPFDSGTATGLLGYASVPPFGDSPVESVRVGGVTCQVKYADPLVIPPEMDPTGGGYTTYTTTEIKAAATAEVQLVMRLFDFPEYAGGIISPFLSIAPDLEVGAAFTQLYRYLTT